MLSLSLCITYFLCMCVQMLKQIKQQLTHERSIKQDAFHQVDELLAQVNNLDIMKTSTKIPNTKGESISLLYL